MSWYPYEEIARVLRVQRERGEPDITVVLRALYKERVEGANTLREGESALVIKSDSMATALREKETRL